MYIKRAITATARATTTTTIAATPDRCSAVFSCAACFVLDKVLFFYSTLRVRVCMCSIYNIHAYIRIYVSAAVVRERERAVARGRGATWPFCARLSFSE